MVCVCVPWGDIGVGGGAGGFYGSNYYLSKSAKTTSLFRHKYHLALCFEDTAAIRIWHPFVSVRHHAHVTWWKARQNFISSANSVFFVHNFCCDKCIELTYHKGSRLSIEFLHVQRPISTPVPFLRDCTSMSRSIYALPDPLEAFTNSQSAQYTNTNIHQTPPPPPTTTTTNVMYY